MAINFLIQVTMVAMCLPPLAYVMRRQVPGIAYCTAYLVFMWWFMLSKEDSKEGACEVVDIVMDEDPFIRVVLRELDWFARPITWILEKIRGA